MQVMIVKDLTLMDKGTKELKKLLRKINKMTTEEYLKLYNEANKLIMEKNYDDDRRIVLLKHNNMWEEIEFKDIKKGDIVKLFEPDNNDLVTGHEIEALSDAYKQNDGILAFEADV